MNLATPISLTRMCELNSLSRAGFYRWSHAPEAVDRDLDLRDEIQQIALAMPCYGWRRSTAELRRRGWPVNHKRVKRLMRENDLLCLKRRKFRVTTDSKYKYPLYPNGAADLALPGINQLWVADITYIRLESKFVYLAVILDAFSRRFVGWALDRNLEAALGITALRRALAERQPVADLVHHSDRSVQYACGDYTEILQDHSITISMSRKGNPYDNAACESFMKTLKYEEVYRQEYRDLAEAQASMGDFVNRTYNHKRLHSAVGYCPPVEFEQRQVLSRKVEDALACVL